MDELGGLPSGVLVGVVNPLVSGVPGKGSTPLGGFGAEDPEPPALISTDKVCWAEAGVAAKTVMAVATTAILITKPFIAQRLSASYWYPRRHLGVETVRAVRV